MVRLVSDVLTLLTFRVTTIGYLLIVPAPACFTMVRTMSMVVIEASSQFKNLNISSSPIANQLNIISQQKRLQYKKAFFPTLVHLDVTTSLGSILDIPLRKNLSHIEMKIDTPKKLVN